MKNKFYKKQQNEEQVIEVKHNFQLFVYNAQNVNHSYSEQNGKQTIGTREKV